MGAHTPLPDGGLTLDQLGQLPLVMTYQTPTSFTPVTKQLELLGVRFKERS